MKKLSVLLMCSLMLILAACGGVENAGDTNSKEDTKEKASSNEVADKSDDKSDKKEEKKAKLEIVNQTGTAWKSYDETMVHSAAVFENTGDVPVQIKETQMNLKAQDGSILTTETMIYAVPSVVLPGEKAYISEVSYLDGTPLEQYKETTYNFGFDETKEKPNTVETSAVKGIKDEYNEYKVTGVVKNTTDELQDDIRIAAALFDANGALLGVLTGSVDVGLNAGSEAGFELSYPELTEGVAEKVATIDVKAYGWSF